MEKLQFKKEIKAPAQKVHDIMLGLSDRGTYQQWTSVFSPSSTYEGSWEKGSKMYFVGVDENGKKGGMVSKIEENHPGRFVSVLHYGILDGENEITSGEHVEAWAGAHENYSFEELDGVTTVTVDLDIVDEHLDYFKETYPLAMEKLKEISES